MDIITQYRLTSLVPDEQTIVLAAERSRVVAERAAASRATTARVARRRPLSFGRRLSSGRRLAGAGR